MSFFNKNISRKIANQKLETKLLLSTIGIDLLFLFFFLVAAFSIITSRYHKLLYQSMQSSSSLVSYEFTNRLEDLVTMTNIVRSDSTVQSTLDEIYQPQEDYAVHYYSDIYSALQKHYLEYRQQRIQLREVVLHDLRQVVLVHAFQLGLLVIGDDQRLELSVFGFQYERLQHEIHVVELVLDLLRVDVLSAAGEDHRLRTAPDVERAVGVQQGDVVARRFGDGAVAGRAFAGVGLRDEFHERRADAAHDFCAAVRRTVVHDDDLCRGQRLDRKSTRLNSSHNA